MQGAIGSASSGDTIAFGCSGDIKVSRTLMINKNLTLDGGGQSVTLDGQNAVEVLQVNTNVNFTLNALTIANGSATDGGGLLYFGGGTVSISNSTFANNSAPNGVGGGIFTEDGGTVNISNSTFTNNSAPNGGGLYNNGSTVNISTSTFASNSAPNAHGGGGLDNVGGGTVNISSSTFTNNSASNSSAGGGGLLNSEGTMSVSSSTFTNNSAFSFGGGGGLMNFSGTMSISGSTVADNSSSAGGGGLFNYTGTLSITGSIVADNSNGNCYGSLTDQGYDLSSDSSCRFTGTGSLQNTDPKLDPNGLGNNGGPTQTLALLDGSPAINKIPSGSFCPSTDQRGISRPQGPACDIGSFEFRVPVLNLPTSPITVNATGANGATVTYTATASEPDDASATPTVSCLPASGSTFPIGTTTVNCTASDAATPPDTTTGSFSVVVQPTLTVSVPGVNATEGSAFSGVVATGTAYGTTNPLSASINWGDGNSSTGSITLNPDGSYSVAGSHTYAEEGSYALTVTVNDSGSLSATGNGSATVADAALTLKQFQVSSPKALHGSLKATFTDADPGGTLSDYTATINWGDGNTVTVSVVKGKLSFKCSGTHTYAKAGKYKVTLTVTDSGGSQLTKTATLTVK